MALHVLDEANRCLGCKKPMCQQGCPIHTNIPEVIRLLKDNHLDDAGRMLFENNPLTTVCSLVCNHENQCEGHCIRNRMPSHDPVHFSIIEDYISTTYANKMTAGPAPKNGMKAAVVGSGPAGLTIAVLLARWGYDVTIFDARDKIGGVMRYGIPNYRLPDSVLDDFQYRHLELKGIHVRPNTTIGKTITIDDLFRDGYKSVFIGAGLWKANAMHIKGETLGNVAFGIDYLANSKAFRLGDDIAVIGVGKFDFFFGHIMPHMTHHISVAVIILIPTLYAVVKGLEAIARAGSILSVLCLAVLVVTVGALIPHMQTSALVSPFLSDLERAAMGALTFVVQTPEIAALGVLVPYLSLIHI